MLSFSTTGLRALSMQRFSNSLLTKQAFHLFPNNPKREEASSMKWNRRLPDRLYACPYAGDEAENALDDVISQSDDYAKLQNDRPLPQSSATGIMILAYYIF